MFRPSYVSRTHAIALEDVCVRCAHRLLGKPAQSRRLFSQTAGIRQIAAVKGQAIERTYFWTNAFRSVRDGQQETQDMEVSAAIAKERRAQMRAVYTATQEHTDAAPVIAAERPHRRRTRLKKEAVEVGAAEQQLPPDASSTFSRAASAAPTNSLRRIINTYLSLSKPRLAFLIVLTTTASYSIYPVPDLLSSSATAAPSLSTLTLGFLTSGTFLTIASANTLNMLFETSTDAKMSRTRNRPLVRGLVSNRSAVLFAILTGVLGTGILWYGVNPTTAILGAGNLVLYSFIYTAFKRIHPVNTWVGAIVGAIPPLMGWCAAASQYSTTPSNPASIWEESKEL